MFFVIFMKNCTVRAALSVSRLYQKRNAIGKALSRRACAEGCGHIVFIADFSRCDHAAAGFVRGARLESVHGIEIIGRALVKKLIRASPGKAPSANRPAGIGQL